MDFFEQQDLARKNSKKLIVLFTLAVIGVIFSVYVLLGVAVTGYNVKMADAKKGIDLTFGELVEEYVATVSEIKEVSRAKKNALSNICRIIGRVPVSEMDAPKIRDFVRERRNGPTAPSPATIGMDLTYIHTILSHGGALTGTDTAHALSSLKAVRTVLAAADTVSR